MAHFFFFFSSFFFYNNECPCMAFHLNLLQAFVFCIWWVRKRKRELYQTWTVSQLYGFTIVFYIHERATKGILPRTPVCCRKIDNRKPTVARSCNISEQLNNFKYNTFHNLFQNLELFSSSVTLFKKNSSLKLQKNIKEIKLSLESRRLS